MSARQRKQVYMHSSIFETGGPRGDSVYHPARQQAVHNEVASRKIYRTAPVVALPRPADMRCTANAGHGVIECGSTEGCGEAGYVRFGHKAEPHAVVQARHPRADTIPREFRSTNSKLDWLDTRAERSSCRDSDKMQCQSNLNASTRKVRELSSEVFGASRLMDKSSLNTSQEIYAVGVMHVLGADTAHHPNVQKRSSSADGRSLSARQRLHCGLAVSCGNQFQRSSVEVPSDASSDVAAPPSAGFRCIDPVGDKRRHTERNYSNIFGKDSPAGTSVKSKKTSPRETTKESVLAEGTVIWQPKAMVPEDKGTPAQREERACWDTRKPMETTSEISRRQRERFVPGARNDPGSVRARSASERKRSELCSGQLRTGMGSARAPHDDGRAGPGPPTASPPVNLGAALRGGPTGRASVTKRPHSAQSRKVESLLSSGVL